MRLGLFARTFALVLFLPVTATILIQVMSLPGEQATLLAFVDSQTRELLSTAITINANAFIANDNAALTEIGARLLKGAPHLRYLVLSRPAEPCLVQLRHGWDERPGDDPVCAKLFAAGTGILDANPLTGERVFQVAYPVRLSGVPWGMAHLGVAIEPYDARLASLHRRAALFTILSLALSSALAYLFARRLTQPLIQLRAVTDRVQHGDLSARTTIRTGDEIEAVASSFNQMAESLILSQRTLTDAHARFELRVADRTLELLESEAQYRALFEQAGAALGVLQRGLLCFWNPALERLTGRCAAALEGLDFAECLHDRDRSAWAGLVARTLAGHQPMPSEGLRLERGGEPPIWVAIACVPIQWRDHPALLVSALDVSPTPDRRSPFAWLTVMPDR